MISASLLPILATVLGLTFVGMSFFLYIQRRTTNKIREKSQASLEKEITAARSSLSFRLQLAAKSEEDEKQPFAEGRTPAQVLVPLMIAGASTLYLANRWMTPETFEPTNKNTITTTAVSAPPTAPTPIAPAPVPAPIVAAPTQTQPTAPPAAPQSPPSPRQQTIAQTPPPQPIKKEWKIQHAPDFPVLDSFIADLRSYQFIFVYDRADETAKIPQSKSSPLLKSRNAWKKWTDYYKISTEQSDWRTLGKFQKATSKRIFVVLPGNWNFSQIEKLMAQGEPMILLGAPYQIYDRKRDRPVNFKNLVFEKFSRETQNWLVVKGDQALTLGLEAGLRVSVPPLLNNYRVKSKTPHANGIGSEGYAPSVRLDVVKDSRSRVVWFDFAPEIKGPTESIQAGIFRYLLRKKHWSFANWPYKAIVSSLLLLETQNLQTDVTSVRAALKNVALEDLPISWVVDAKSLTSKVKLSSKDSILCRLSFTNLSLPTAIKSIADCKETVKKYTDLEVAGIMTPDPVIVPFAYDALFNTRLRLLISRANNASPMPYVAKAGREYLLVLPASYNTLHSLTPDVADQHFRIVRNSAGFSYTRLPTSQFLKSTKIFKNLHNNINLAQGRFLTAEELAEWRLSRERLLWGESVLAGVSGKYLPFTLRTDDSGSLLAQGLSGVPDRMPASEVPSDEK